MRSGLKSRLSNWFHFVGAAVCVLSMVGGFVFFLFQENPNRMELEKMEKEGVVISEGSYRSYGIDRAVRILGTAGGWFVGFLTVGLGSLLSLGNKEGIKKLQSRAWLVVLGSLLLGFAMTVVL